MAKGKTLHVVPHDDNWAVRRAGSKRVTVTKRTQQEAFEAARDIARNQGLEVLTHRRDGKIRKKNSYGKDPYPPKG